MTNGIELRSQIDTETFKGLLAINGGGALALLSFVAALLNKGDENAIRYLSPLLHAALLGIVFLMVGVTAAVVHNYLRRRCSLVFQRHNYRPPNGRLFGFTLTTPTVCFFSLTCMWLSLALFVSAGVAVAIVGLQTI